MKKFSISLFLLICFFTQISAQVVDYISVYSQRMDVDVDNTIILPAGYDVYADKRYPVLYLLHGYSGNHKTWIGIKKDLPQEASRLGIIIVCPDGKNAWYWDSLLNPKLQYETYVSQELVEFIDKKYKTITSPQGRAITGLSMGGHGGLWLGFRHQNVFGACGSMSGGVDIRPFPQNWEMSKSIGDYATNKEVWENHTVITQLDKAFPKTGKQTLSIIIDCGYEDFFFDVNNSLHNEMLKRNVAHDYIVRPGKHDAPYWNNAIDYQLLFFSKIFKQKAE